MILDRTKAVEAAQARRLARWRHRENWHRWFAWRPVDVGDGIWVWLSWVQRKYHFQIDFSDTGGIFGGPSMIDRCRWDYDLTEDAS